MFYIGIDPGVNGGCAILDDDMGLTVHRCPKDVKGMSEALYSFQFEECYAVIEKVHSFPGQGVVSTFTFGNKEIRIGNKEITPLFHLAGNTIL